jgi:Glycosyl hydrolases family 17
MTWTAAENILTFVFEAFDEEGKGSHELLEPEKHWGLFKKDRTPKLVMQGYFAVSGA